MNGTRSLPSRGIATLESSLTKNGDEDCELGIEHAEAVVGILGQSGEEMDNMEVWGEGKDTGV